MCKYELHTSRLSKLFSTHQTLIPSIPVWFVGRHCTPVSTDLLQVVVGQVESRHTDEVVDIRRHFADHVVRSVDRVYEVFFLRLGRRKRLQAVVGDVQLYRRFVEVLLHAAYLVLGDVNLDHTPRVTSHSVSVHYGTVFMPLAPCDITNTGIIPV